MNIKFMCCLMTLGGFLLSVENIYAQDIIEKPEGPVKPVHVSSGNAKLQQLERQYQQDYRKSVNLFNNGEIQEALQAFRNMKTRKYYANHKSEINSWITKCETELGKIEKAKAERKMLAEAELKKGIEQVDSLMDIFQFEKAKKVLDDLKKLPVQNSSLQTKEKELLGLIRKKNLADNRIRRMAEGLKRLNPQGMGNFSPIYTAVKIGKKWGFADSTFHIVIPCQYDDARSFQENGLAAVCKGKKWGVINKNGVPLTPFKYYKPPVYKEGRAVASVNWNKECFIDENGEEITHYYYDAADFSEGFAVVNKKKNGRYYYVDRNGVEQPHHYKFAHDFGDGLAEVSDYVNGNYTSFLIDKNFKVITHFPDSLISSILCHTFREGLLTVTGNRYPRDLKYGFMDKSGKLIIPLKYDVAYNFENGYAEVGNKYIEKGKKYTKYLYVDKKGNEYSYNPSDKSLHPFDSNGNLGFKNAKGNVISPPSFSTNFLGFSWNDGMYVVIKNHRFGLINEFGTSTFDFE